MNEREEKLTASLARVTAEQQKLKAAYLIMANELKEIKEAMKPLSDRLANSSDEMVDLSHRSLGASLNLLGLLLTANRTPPIDDCPSITDIQTAAASVIEMAENVTSAANLVSNDAHDVYAYIHTSHMPNI